MESILGEVGCLVMCFIGEIEDGANDNDILLLESSASSLSSQEQKQQQQEHPIILAPETDIVLSSCPRLLTRNMMEQLTRDALPSTVKTMTWERIFSVGRDGDSFYRMIERAKYFRYTIMVMETTTGHILGGFVARPWETSNKTFYGTGQSFLFANHPKGCSRNNDDDGDDFLHIYKWTGDNHYYQIVCDMIGGYKLAMGGGEDSFGLVVNNNFTKGATGRCSTFDNPALIPDSTTGGTFGIVSFEVYGFSSMAESWGPQQIITMNKSGSLMHCMGDPYRY